MAQAPAFFLLFHSIEDTQTSQQPGSLYIPGNAVKIFRVRQIVDLGDPFGLQLFDERFHISIDLLLLKQVMEGKGAALFHHPEGLPNHLTLVRLGPYFMKDKIADSSVKGFVRKGQAGRISLAEGDVG